MAHAYDHDDPEQMIAALNRNRHIKIFAVVTGLAIILAVMFLATTAMYNEDPAARALTNPPK